jgi:enamine deaminase RidA (YjgF/YER057c/UK114 family)
MDDIVRISSAAPWEPIFGYSRAVKAGDWVAVSGSTALDEKGQLAGRGQMYVQARQAISNIAAALKRLGLGLDRVVRTRVYVTELDRFGDVARAHREMFAEAPPASTLVQVARLVHPDMLIEIEADAYAGPGADIATRPKAARRIGVPGLKSRAPRKRSSVRAVRSREKPAPRRSR